MMDVILGYLVAGARWLFLLALCLVHPGQYDPWKGKVVEIVRPHEIRVKKDDGTVVSVRIYGVQCPMVASRQPFSGEVMRYVTDRLEGKVVQVQPLPGRIEGVWYRPRIHLRDRLDWEKNPSLRYDRLIGLVYIDGRSFSEELMEKGMAWWYKPFVPFERGYKHLEDKARTAKVGLWSSPDPIPPWKYHHTPVVDAKDFRQRVHPFVRMDGPINSEGPGTTGAEKHNEKAVPAALPMPSPTIPKP